MESLAAHLLIAFGLIALNALFVLTEFAIVKVRSSRLELLARKGSVRAVLVQSILQNLDVYLSAIQMGITMTSLGLGWVGEPAVAHVIKGYLLEWNIPYISAWTHGLSFTIAFGVITFLHILLGELVPRSIGLQKAEIVALWMAVPLRVFFLTFKIPVTFMAQASIKILHLFRLTTAAEADQSVSEDEMRIILGASEEKAGIPLERLLLLDNIFDFGSTKVSEVMVPKDRAVCLSPEKSWEENLSIIRSRRFSRYPLSRAGLEAAEGYVHVKDLLGAAMPPDLKLLKRKLPEVGSGELLERLIQNFADKGAPIALVREADGSVSGLVSLEDILEEIVGEVHDEFDLPHAWSFMDVLVPNAVEIGIDATEPAAVIARLIDKLKGAVSGLDHKLALKIVTERESRLSTALGHGVAVPHGRIPNLERPMVAIGRAQKNFHFLAPDKTQVKLVFLILTPTTNPLLQLKILSRVASLVSNETLRRRMLRAKTADHLLDTIRTADTVFSI